MTGWSRETHTHYPKRVGTGGGSWIVPQTSGLPQTVHVHTYLCTIPSGSVTPIDVRRTSSSLRPDQNSYSSTQDPVRPVSLLPRTSTLRILGRGRSGHSLRSRLPGTRSDFSAMNHTSGIPRYLPYTRRRPTPGGNTEVRTRSGTASPHRTAHPPVDCTRELGFRSDPTSTRRVNGLELVRRESLFVRTWRELWTGPLLRPDRPTHSHPLSSPPSDLWG